MRLRGGEARRDERPDGGELESWILDLAGGETSVRRLRERLGAAVEPSEDTCTSCGRTAALEGSAPHDGHDQGRLTA